MIVMCLTYLLWLAGEPAVTAVPVDVVAADGITGSLVQRICVEAESIWRPAGISFDWHITFDRSRTTQEDAPHHSALSITVGDGRASVDPDGALGWITFTADRPGHSIYLSRAAADGMLAHTPGLRVDTITGHEILIGRALGRALAHELGHYFLQSKGHTSAGLMRSAWPSDEFFGLNAGGFKLTRDQQATAVTLLLRSTLPWSDSTGE